MIRSARIVVSFAVVLVVVGVLGMASYVNTQRLIESNNRVIRTHEVVENLGDVLSALKDAETGQRGFILTGDDYYLEPYNQAVGVIADRLARLADLTRDDPAYQADLRRLKALSDSKLNELRQTIDLRRKSGLAATMPVILTGRGKRSMDDIRELVAQLETREHLLLQRQEDASKANARWIMWTISGGIPLSLLALAVGAIVLMGRGWSRVLVVGTEARGARRLEMIARFAFALAAVVLAAFLRSWLLKLGPMPLFVTFYPAVLLVATVAGGGPGTLATVFSSLVADYWFIPPIGQFAVKAPSDVLALAIFTGTSLALCVMAERLRRSRWAEAFGEAKQQEAEELARKNEELAQQSEELAQQNEELQSQSEEIQSLNAELTGRENMLQKLLDATRLLSGEEPVLKDICAAAKEMLGPPASAVVVFERRENQLLVRAGAGVSAGGESWPIENTFADVVMKAGRTACLNDAALRPDLKLLPVGEAPFQAALSTPLHVSGEIFGSVTVYSLRKQEWTGEQFRLAEWLAAQCGHILEILRLQDSQLRLAAIVESSDDAILSKDLNGAVQTWNAGAETLFGYRAQEIIGQPITLLLPPDRPTEEDEIMHQLRAGKRVDHRETVRKAKDGRLIDVLVTISPLKDQAGRIIGASKIARDITQRKRAEDALRESENRFRTMADAIPQLAWVAKADGWIYWYNQRWYQYTGTTPDQMEGWGWQSVHDPAELPKVLERWRASIATGEPFDMVFPLRGADGAFRPFLTRITPLKDAHGRVLQWFGTNTDIAERKQYEDLLRRTAEELARSNHELEQFAYVASHDLQEPLRQVRSFVGLLKERFAGKLEGKTARYFEFVYEGAERMSNLVSDLLAYSHVGAREQKGEMVSCQRALDSALANLRASIEETGARITHDELPTLRADRTRLTQVFQNLVGNAIKFRRDGLTPQIHIGCRRDDGNWVFAIRDNGIGIEPEQHDRVFVIFQRLHGREKYPGTGIGLAICKKIIEQHGGRIWLESMPGEGSTFYFTLPEDRVS